jgi:GNAT superfamily N-acetyltransferase
MAVMGPHPVADLIRSAAAGHHPVPDGGWHRVAPWRPGVEGVFAFTGHAVLAVDDEVTDERLEGLGVDGLGGANHPRVLLDLAGEGGWIDSLDALLVRRVPVTPTYEPLVDRPDLDSHPRAHWARAVRDDVRVLGHRELTDQSIATLSRGIGGLLELSVELEPTARGRGRATALIEAAVAAVPEDLVVAAVAPGNAASLRAFLAAGFAVLGSVQLLRPADRRTEG